MIEDDMLEILHEGLITSYNEEIKKLLTKMGITLTVYKPNAIEFEQRLSDEQAKQLRQILNVTGWYVSLPAGTNNKDTDHWYTSKEYLNANFNPLLEPKFDKVDPANLPPFLYHVSPTTTRNNILKNGLRPRAGTQKAYHPERIYFTTSERDAFDYITMQINQYKHNGIVKTIEDFDIWKIDSEFLDGENIHIDPMFKQSATWSKLPTAAVFTLEIVPKEDVQSVRMGRNYKSAYIPEWYTDKNHIRRLANIEVID